MMLILHGELFSKQTFFLLTFAHLLFMVEGGEISRKKEEKHSILYKKASFLLRNKCFLE